MIKRFLNRAQVSNERRVFVWPLVVAFLILTGMYCSNTNWGKDKDAERGDGKYHPILARGDGHLMYLMTQSFILDQDLHYDNNLKRFGDPWRQEKTKTGQKGIPHPIGPTLVQALPFAIAHLGAIVVNAFGADVPLHGYSLWHQRIVFFVSVLAGFGTMCLGFLVARKKIGGTWEPVVSAIAALFGTSLIYYSTYAPSYAHALDAFFSSLFLTVWMLGMGRWTTRRMVVLGALLGVAGLVRVTSLGLGVVLVVEFMAAWIGAVTQRGGAEKTDEPPLAKKLALCLLTLVVTILFYSPQFITWKIVYGEWFTSPSGPRFMRLMEPEWLELLFSSRNGWLSTHPLAYASLLGLFLVPRSARIIAVALGSAVALQVYVNSCVFDWWAGASFGQRRLCTVTLVLVFGLTAIIRFLSVRFMNERKKLQKVMTCVALAFFLVPNVLALHWLRNGRSPGAGLHRMCCGHSKFSKRYIEPIYHSVGYPFAWPANWLFAARFNVLPSRWDRIVGRYADLPDLRLYNKGAHRSKTFNWSLNAWNTVSGFHVKKNKAKLAATVSDAATFLLPLYDATEDRTLVLNVYAREQQQGVELWMNGHATFNETLKEGWNRLDVILLQEHLERGVNEVTIKSPLGDVPTSFVSLFETPPPSIGLMIRTMKIGYPQKK